MLCNAYVQKNVVEFRWHGTVHAAHSTPAICHGALSLHLPYLVL